MPHGADHPTRPEDVAIHPGHGSFGLPVGLELARHGRKVALPSDVVELEPRMSGVHVQMNSERATGRQHALRQILGRDARTVEITGKSFLGETKSASCAVNLVGPARRRSAPPGPTPGVELSILNEGRQILP